MPRFLRIKHDDELFNVIGHESELDRPSCCCCCWRGAGFASNDVISSQISANCRRVWPSGQRWMTDGRTDRHAAPALYVLCVVIGMLSDWSMAHTPHGHILLSIKEGDTFTCGPGNGSPSVGFLLSYFQSTKAFPFLNWSQLNFGYWLVTAFQIFVGYRVGFLSYILINQ